MSNKSFGFWKSVEQDDTIVECKHTHISTISDRCIDCGKLIFATENRVCGDCKCSTPTNCRGTWNYCNKKLIKVKKNMTVYYKIEEGSCFEDKDE